MTTDLTKAQLLAAHIPTSVFGTTLKLAGYEELRALITGRSYISAGGLANYLICGHRTPGQACLALPLFAKELHISGVGMIYASSSMLMRALRCHEDDIEPIGMTAAQLTKNGNGYLAIPDIFNRDDFPEDSASRREYADYGDYLATKVWHGGGLILGGRAPTAQHLESLGPSFTEIYNARFTTITVR